jgi:hypothetical protein
VAFQGEVHGGGAVNVKSGRGIKAPKYTDADGVIDIMSVIVIQHHLSSVT